MRRLSGGLHHHRAQAVFVTAASCLASVAALAQPTVSFDPDPVVVLHSVCSGDSFYVSVDIDETPTPVQGFQISFQFAPSVVSPDSVLPGVLLSGSQPFFFDWVNEDAVGDSVRVEAALLGHTVSGPGELVRLNFVKLTPGISLLEWELTDFRDGDNGQVAVLTDDGFIQIDACPIPVEAASWGRIKLKGSEVAEPPRSPR